MLKKIKLKIFAITLLSLSTNFAYAVCYNVETSDGGCYSYGVQERYTTNVEYIFYKHPTVVLGPDDVFYSDFPDGLGEGDSASYGSCMACQQ